MLTVDASVWVSAQSPNEPGHAASRALLNHVAAHDVTVVVPTLLLAEFAGVISRTRGDPVLAFAQAELLKRLRGIRWVALDDVLAVLAAKLAAQQSLRGADAVYAAVAAANGCALVSLDREHLTRLPPVVATLTPTDALVQLTANP